MAFLDKSIVNLKEGFIIDGMRGKKITISLDSSEGKQVQRFSSGEVCEDLIAMITEEVIGTVNNLEDLTDKNRRLFYLSHIGGYKSYSPQVTFLLGYFIANILSDNEDMHIAVEEEDLTQDDILKEIDAATEENKTLLDKLAEKAKDAIRGNQLL